MKVYLELKDLTEFSDDSLDPPGIAERRSNLRLNEAFPARVRGVDAEGIVFESDAVVKSISLKGLYLQLKKCVEPGARLFIVMQFSKASARWGTGARVALHGLVLRCEPQLDDNFGAAVAIIHHRFL